MEDIIKMLMEKPTEALALLRSQGKKPDDIKALMEEANEMKRNIRPTQVDIIQEPRKVGEKMITPVRIPIDYIGKIVSASTAFEVGEPVTLIPQYADKSESSLAKLVKNLWRVNRIDNIVQKAVAQKKRETQSAILFYMVDIKPGSMFSKLLAFIGMQPQKREIKARLLENSKGSMYPYFDSLGDMTAFVWDFDTKGEDGKDQKNTWIFTETDIFKVIGDGLPDRSPHGFGKIPIVYLSQDEPEHKKAEGLIDRQEVTLSRFCDSNDRTAYPILKTYGEVKSLPQDGGKVINFPMIWDEEAGKHVHGDADFLAQPNAPDAVKAEYEIIDDLISYTTSTPVLSLNKLKGIGNVASATVKLMFLDPIIKAKSNEGENRTMYERILNVMISGIVTTTNTKLSSEAEKLYFDIQFNSILPDDLSETAKIVDVLAKAGVASKKTLVEYLGLNPDVKGELEMIEKEKTSVLQPEP